MPRVVASSIGRDGVVLAAVDGASDALWAAVGPTLKGQGRAELDLIVNDHHRARAQEAAGSTVAEDNAAIRHLLALLPEAAADFSGRARERLEAYLLDLGGAAGERLHAALTRLAPSRQGREAWHLNEFDLDEVRQALDASLTETFGPRKDWELRQMAFRLTHLFKRYSGQRVTHSAVKGAIYQQAPQSPAGRFVLAVVKAIDPGVAASAVSAAMAEVIAHRRARPVQTL